jgi:signal transduction histidine kinase
MSVADLPETNSVSEIEMLRNQLEQAQRMAAIGELTSTTTHEFNNLLMTILNYAQMGIRHNDDATRDKALTKIFDAATKAAKVTNCILGLARNRSDGLEPTDLKSVVSDSMLLLEREMRKYRIAVELQLDDVPLAIAAGNDIQRVLLNLLTNARQAIGETGTIRIRLRADADGKFVVLSIRDNGGGIDPSQLPRIFEPFFSTKSGPDASGKGGTGLGLAACRDVIEKCNGRIRVESAIGKGTEFHIRLPVAPPA